MINNNDNNNNYNNNATHQPPIENSSLDRTTNKAVITFGIFPDRFLRVVHLDYYQFSNYSNEHAQDRRFAILPSHWIVSLNQVAAAAIAALIREHHHTTSSENEETPCNKIHRGIALDTVVSMGGSLNETSVLNTFLFNGSNGLKKSSADDSFTKFSVLCIGFDCTEEEMDGFIKKALGNEATPSALSNLTCLRNVTELKDIAKVYKLSPIEWDVNSYVNSTTNAIHRQRSLQQLEESIINRIATKHIV